MNNAASSPSYLTFASRRESLSSPTRKNRSAATIRVRIPYWRPSILLALIYYFVTLYTVSPLVTDFSAERRLHYREKVRSMFFHAYEGYLQHAYPLDELKPLTCVGVDTWGSFSLTLVDALDTLLVMGNRSEFIRAAVDLIDNHRLNPHANVNVSVFETNIRVVGGLLSAHMLLGRLADDEKMGVDVSALRPDGWPCAGPLLDLAERFAQRLLPAFNTETGMPYGTVNLRYGVNHYETPETCTAGVGTFLLEFGTLSRLTGNPHYERVALKALKALWESRSSIGLVGNHINVQTGVWTATDAGIGAGVDSYFEYLVKGALLFQRPELMRQFQAYEAAINAHVRHDDWFLWVSMTKGQVSLPVFQSLEAFWPGMLALVGRVDDAERIMLTYNQILRQYGVPPEFYNLQNKEPTHRRNAYPLRPEIAESLVYLYRATRDPTYLHIGAAMIEVIDQVAKTSCGYATIHDVLDSSLEDRMESFFLAETTKYLYLLFDEENFLHNDGSMARLIQTTNGECMVDAGGYIFNTEAHPIDPGIVYCCSAKREHDSMLLGEFEGNGVDFLELLGLQDGDDEVGEVAEEEEEIDVAAEAEESMRKDGRMKITDTRETRHKPPREVALQYDENDSTVLIDNDPAHIRMPLDQKMKKLPPYQSKSASGQSHHSADAGHTGTNNAAMQKISEKLARILASLNSEVDVTLGKRGTPNEEEEEENGLLSNEEETSISMESVCDKCSTLLNDPSVKSQKGWRLFLEAILEAAMGGRQISNAYKHPHFTLVHGPICRPQDKQHRSRITSNAADDNRWRTRYFNIPPPAETGVEEELSQESLDAVKQLSFKRFAYSRMENGEEFELLRHMPRPWLSQFTGLKQVLPAAMLNNSLTVVG